ncbi:MAG TPA: hypothetical protein VK995_06975, partial [Oceanipulchritudo sp.]|nr:hypothetical protein [Oceanipulchritudo sp.]
EHAAEVAQLYKEFYQAYWQPKAPEFPGLERQFLFQDLRYARAFDHIYDEFFPADGNINMTPLHKIGYESVPGRTFRIDLPHNNSTTQVEALLYGMQQTFPRFEKVAARCSEVMPLLDENQQTFFNDNLRLYAYYMSHLSKALYHYVLAYKHQDDRNALLRHLDLAWHEASRARGYLYEGQHGVFHNWYANADPLSRTFQIDTLLERIQTLKGRVPSIN